MNLKNLDDVILKGNNHELKSFNFSQNKNWQGSFNFIQMADTQFGLTEYFKTDDDSNWEIEIAYAKKCCNLINQMNPSPEFVIVCGDMINAYPGTNHRKNQISDFLKVNIFFVTSELLLFLTFRLSKSYYPVFLSYVSVVITTLVTHPPLKQLLNIAPILVTII